MKKGGALLQVLYKYRHPMALLLMIAGFWLIYRITLLRFFPPNSQLNIYDAYYSLWHSKQYYLRFIVIMNILIKPIMIYCLYVLLLNCLVIQQKKC